MAEKRADNRSRGSILILALWSLFLLSFFCAILGGGMRQKLELVRRLKERDALRAAAELTLARARAALAAEKEKTYQCQDDDWSNDSFSFARIDAGESVAAVSHSVAGGEEGSVSLAGLEDEESKINVNKASPAVMARLFTLCGMEEGPAQNLAYSIADWRDGDDFLSVPLGSAESSYYRSLQYPYEAKNADFEALEELLLVKGMDGNFFKKIRNYITIYGDGAVNVNTAPVPVLRALGLSDETAGLLLEHRNGKDGVPGTADDAAFMSVSAITGDLTAAYHLNDTELKEISNCVAANLLGVSSRYFTVNATITMKHGRGNLFLRAVIDTKGGVLNWEET